MTRLSLLVFVVVVFSSSLVDGRIERISSGNWFSNCVGFCRRSISLQSNPLVLTSTKEFNPNAQSAGIVTTTTMLKGKEWRKVVELINRKVFNALPERLKCQDCQDGRAE